MTLVDPAVSRAKLERELELWRTHEQEYRGRGWIILRADLEALIVDVAFIALAPLGSLVPVVFPTVRFRYDDFDLLAPSLSFVDIFTGRPMSPLIKQAFVGSSPGQPLRNIFITDRQGREFLCIPGTREYHEHSDHNGDLWLLYRRQGHGSLAVLCDRVASSMTALIAGTQLQMQMALAMAPTEQPIEAAEQHQRGFRAAWDQQIEAQERQLDGNRRG